MVLDDEITAEEDSFDVFEEVLNEDQTSVIETDEEDDVDSLLDSLMSEDEDQLSIDGICNYRRKFHAS